MPATEGIVLFARRMAAAGFFWLLAGMSPAGAAYPTGVKIPPPVAPADDEAGTPEEEEDESEALPTIELPDPPEPKVNKKKGSGKSKAPPKAKKPKGDKICGFRTPVWEHTVRAGENLGRIAGMYGVQMRDIKAINPKVKAKPDYLIIGQKIKVCPDIAPHLYEEGTYTVKNGDSLSEIAAKHGAMKVSELIGMQKGSLAKKLRENPKLLKAGDELTVLVDRGVVGAFAPPDEDKGFLKVGIALEAGKHYYIKRPHLAFGTGHTIKAIKAAISRYMQQKGIKGGPQIHVGDISARGGGPLKGHKSHQKGIDVDVGLVLKGEDASEVRFLTGRTDNLDVGRTWSLIKAFIDTNEVRSVFLDYGLQKLLYEHAKKKGVSEGTLDELFQYPRGKGRGFGIIRHWNWHRDHFHVRFKR
jgi:hypothetical protein